MQGQAPRAIDADYRDGVRISELSAQLGVPVSTVRHYERIGLLSPPARTASGYRNYDDAATTRLRFVTRARGLGLSCDQVAELLPVWDGADCAAAREQVVQLIDEKLVQIASRVAELTAFAEQLTGARAELDSGVGPAECRADLDCCVPATPGRIIGVEPEARHSRLRLIDL